jgi:hypothetical protein
MKISKQQFLDDIKTLQEYCRSYFLHPIEHIKHPPDIEWQSAVIATFAINIVYGVLRAVYSFSLINAVIGLLITPLMAAAVLALTTLFLFYFFQFSFQRTFPFKKISTVLFISYLPASLFFLGSAIYPPLFLMGLVLMSALLAVGLVENFQVPRKTVLILVSAGAFLAVLFWVFDQFYNYHTPIQPKSMDQLEDEIR